MLDAPIGGGANIFITIVILAIAAAQAVIAVDTFKSAKTDKKSDKE